MHNKLNATTSCVSKVRNAHFEVSSLHRTVNTQTHGQHNPLEQLSLARVGGERNGMGDDLKYVLQCCDVQEAISCVRICDHNTNHHDSLPLQVGSQMDHIIASHKKRKPTFKLIQENKNSESAPQHSSLLRFECWVFQRKFLK